MSRDIWRCRIFLSRRICRLRGFSKTGGNSAQYPELATAVINGPEAVGDKLRYEFVKNLGVKG